MTDWKIVYSDVNDPKPAEVDTTSSQTVVYERKNFEEVTIPATQEGESDIVCWQYEERELTKEEYNTASLAAEMTNIRHESDIIDEYTETLIVNGLL